MRMAGACTGPNILRCHQELGVSYDAHVVNIGAVCFEPCSNDPKCPAPQGAGEQFSSGFVGPQLRAIAKWVNKE